MPMVMMSSTLAQVGLPGGCVIGPQGILQIDATGEFERGDGGRGLRETRWWENRQ